MKSTLNVLAKTAKAYFFVLEQLARVILTFLIVMVTVQVFSRNLTGKGINWSDEIASVMLIWLTFASLAVSTAKGLQICITFVVDRLPAVVQTVINKIIDLMMIFLGVVILIYSTKLIQSTSSSLLPATHLPTSFQYVMLPVSGIGLIAYHLLRLLGFKGPLTIEEHNETEQEEIDDVTQ